MAYLLVIMMVAMTLSGKSMALLKVQKKALATQKEQMMAEPSEWTTVIPTQ